MENILNINDIPKHEPVELIETDYYDQIYCCSLNDYGLIKEYIEKYITKIQTPDVCYIFKNGKDKDPYIYNSGTIKDLLKPVKYVEIDEKGRKREYPFF